MTIVASIVSVMFVLLAILHVYWAAGGRAGIEKVIPQVEGKPAITPGKIITLGVAMGLMGVASVAYALGNVDLTSYLMGDYVIYAGWFLALIFFIRAVGDFNLVGFFKKYKGSDFATYDSRYYSPFCLLVSIVFVFLVTSGQVVE